MIKQDRDKSFAIIKASRKGRFYDEVINCPGFILFRNLF